MFLDHRLINEGSVSDYRAAFDRTWAGIATEDDAVTLSHALSRGIEGLTAAEVEKSCQLLTTKRPACITVLSSESEVETR